MAKKKSAGWVPDQHGAWAMIIVPFIVGLLLVLPYRPLDGGDAALGITWLIGYFAYHAAVLILKSPPKRRHQYYGPLITYGSIAGIAGLVTLWFRGWEILWWTPLYAVLLGTSLYLASSKRERSLLSGVLTVVASCGLMGVLRSTADVDFVRPDEIAVIAAVTAYFVGTVFHVKALIRERNKPASAWRSVVYHAVLLAGLVLAVAMGWLSWPWLIWGAAMVARAYLMPKRSWRPAQIGIVEIVLSVAVLVLVLAA